jgi:hypothetical protein
MGRHSRSPSALQLRRDRERHLGAADGGIAARRESHCLDVLAERSLLQNDEAIGLREEEGNVAGALVVLGVDGIDPCTGDFFGGRRTLIVATAAGNRENDEGDRQTRFIACAIKGYVPVCCD